MKFEMQANTTEILGEDDVEGVKLADGREIPTDLVVMAEVFDHTQKQPKNQV